MSIKIPKGVTKEQLQTLVKESVDEVLQEKEMSDSEVNAQERIVKKLKGKYPEFKQKYGKRAKQVMYAVAAKMAEKEKK